MSKRDEVARLKHELSEAHEKIQQLRGYINELETDLAELRAPATNSADPIKAQQGKRQK